MKYLVRLCGLALMVIAIPLSIPGLLVVGLFFLLPLLTMFFLFNLIQELWFALKMGWKRRYVPWYMLSDLEPGDRLIVESPTLGWRISRLWFVPSRLFSQCPLTPPKSDDEYKEFDNKSDPFPVHPFDEWVYERCLSPDSGAGVLIRAWNGHRLAKYFERRNPGIQIIQVWSAPVCFKRERIGNAANDSFGKTGFDDAKQ
jgi:hypothetical protein